LLSINEEILFILEAFSPIQAPFGPFGVSSGFLLSTTTLLTRPGKRKMWRTVIIPFFISNISCSSMRWINRSSERVKVICGVSFVDLCLTSLIRK
jgi:hypothetical protein